MSDIRHVDHVQLPIALGGARQARVFYEELLGLRELRDPALDRPGTLRYGLGRQRLDLSEGYHTGAAPQAHLALRVSDVAALAARFRHAGVAVDDAPLFDAQRLYVVDPFGNHLELIEADRPIHEQDHHVTPTQLAI